jgi:hypothetical protein
MERKDSRENGDEEIYMEQEENIINYLYRDCDTACEVCFRNPSRGRPSELLLTSPPICQNPAIPSSTSEEERQRRPYLDISISARKRKERMLTISTCTVKRHANYTFVMQDRTATTNPLTIIAMAKFQSS